MGKMDLTGKVIIKASLGDDYRRIPIHNEELTYDELILMMERVFRGKLDQNDDITLKYKDEDGDLITIFDSADLLFAIQSSRVLKLTILFNKPEEAAEKNYAKLNFDVKKELREIRDRVVALLDQLEDDKETNGINENEPKEEINQNQLNESFQNMKEFDPLQNQPGNEINVQEEVKPKYSMPETPTPQPISGPPSSTSSNTYSGPQNAMTQQQSMYMQQQQQQQHQQQQQQGAERPNMTPYNQYNQPSMTPGAPSVLPSGHSAPPTGIPQAGPPSGAGVPPVGPPSIGGPPQTVPATPPVGPPQTMPGAPPVGPPTSYGYGNHQINAGAPTPPSSMPPPASTQNYWSPRAAGPAPVVQQPGLHTGAPNPFSKTPGQTYMHPQQGRM